MSRLKSTWHQEKFITIRIKISRTERGGITPQPTQNSQKTSSNNFDPNRALGNKIKAWFLYCYQTVLHLLRRCLRSDAISTEFLVESRTNRSVLGNWDWNSFYLLKPAAYPFKRSSNSNRLCLENFNDFLLGFLGLKSNESEALIPAGFRINSNRIRKPMVPKIK